MVDLGVLPSPLAQSAFRMDTKFDLPAAISKLRYTTTKLRPRDGPSLQWRNEFADLLAMNGLTDYISLSPPTRQASYATYADANDAESAFAANMRSYQHWNALLYHLLQGCMDLSGTHYRLDTDYISQHFAAGDLRDGKGLYLWATSFKTAADPTAQGELLRKVYAKGLVSVSIGGEALVKHITDLAADWSVITGNSKEQPAGFYDALLNTLPTKPETSKVVIFRTWIATKVADSDLMLLDMDVFLRTATTYISVVGFPAEQGPGHSVNALGTNRNGDQHGNLNGNNAQSSCKLCDARCCFGTSFNTCLSFNKNLDFPEATTRGERRYVNLCRQYLKENPTVKKLKGVRIRAKKAEKPAEGADKEKAGAPAAAAPTAEKDKVVAPIIDVSMLRNILGDDDIGDEDDFNQWMREQDASFQGVNAIIDSQVELVAEPDLADAADGTDDTEPDVPPSTFKSGESDGSGGVSGSTSFESGEDWQERLAAHTAEVDGLRASIEQAQAAAQASEVARQSAEADALSARQSAAAATEAVKVSFEAHIEKLNQQVAQLMQSPQRGTPMLHGGALHGMGGTPSTLGPPTVQQSCSAPLAAHANPALARVDDPPSGLVAPIAHAFNSDEPFHRQLVPAPAATPAPMVPVGGGSPASTAFARGGSPAVPMAAAGGGAATATATPSAAAAPTPAPRVAWTSLSASSESDEAITPASAPTPASASASERRRQSDKGKTVPELMAEALAKEQKEKRELQADIKKLKERWHIPTWIREAAYNGLVQLHELLRRYGADCRKRDLVLALLAANQLVKYIDKGAMRRVAYSIVSGIAVLVRDAVERITPSSVGRICQAISQTLTAVSMLVISLSDAVSKLFRALIPSTARAGERAWDAVPQSADSRGGHTGGASQPPPPRSGHMGGGSQPPPAAPAANTPDDPNDNVTVPSGSQDAGMMVSDGPSGLFTIPESPINAARTDGASVMIGDGPCELILMISDGANVQNELGHIEEKVVAALRKSPIPSSAVLMDGGATCGIRTTTRGAIPNTWRKPVGSLAVGDSGAKLVSHGSYLYGETRIGSDGLEQDLVHRCEYTPTGIANIDSEGVEVEKMKSTLMWVPGQSRQFKLADGRLLKCHMTGNLLSWLKVKPIDDPDRLYNAIRAYQRAKALH